MNIDITGHHVDITPALREYTTEKMARLERHFDRISKIHVILSVEKLRHKAEATVSTNGANLFANAEEADMYAAIDALVDKLDRQANKLKEKRIDQHRGFRAQACRPAEDHGGSRHVLVFDRHVQQEPLTVARHHPAAPRALADPVHSPLELDRIPRRPRRWATASPHSRRGW